MKNSIEHHASAIAQKYPGSFFYLGPTGDNLSKTVQSGLLPLSKNHAKVLRSKGILPQPGDLIIVVTRVDTNKKRQTSCQYNLVSLCKVLQSLRKVSLEEKRQMHLSCVLEVKELFSAKPELRCAFKDFNPADSDLLPFVDGL